MGIRQFDLGPTDDHGIPAREEASVSTTRTQIEEHDVVAFREAIGNWPAGTEGAVIHQHRGFNLIEISNEFGEALDEIEVLPEQLRLVWKCPPPDTDD
jgi:hypothetical protein